MNIDSIFSVRRIYYLWHEQWVIDCNSMLFTYTIEANLIAKILETSTLLNTSLPSLLSVLIIMPPIAMDPKAS